MKRKLAIGSMIGTALAASAVLAMSGAAGAAGGPRPPDVSTDKVLHALGTSAELTGAVNPNGSPTTYYFQFGPTTAYAYQTPSGTVSGNKRIRVGQFAKPFALGFHYRLVATNAGGTKFGRDRIFQSKGTKFGIELFPPPEPVPYGHSYVVRGRMSGPGSVGRRLALQSSPWPYHEAFEQVGRPTTTNAAGLFSFPVGALPISTQFRIITLDPLPRVSKVLTVQIAARVTLKMRSSSRPGLVRLYGTVTPVEVGARVEIQLKKAARPGKSEKKEERTFKFATKALTIVKRATKKFSRFSIILNVRKSGKYRATVLPRTGAIVPGSSRQIYLHAATGSKKH